MKKIESINLMEKFSLFTKQWTPQIVEDLNGKYIKSVRLRMILCGMFTKMRTSYSWIFVM